MSKSNHTALARYGCEAETERQGNCKYAQYKRGHRATVKAAYCERGMKAALMRKHRKTPPVRAKIAGDVGAGIIALRCGDPPSGYSRWTLRLLADKAAGLDILEAISHVSIGGILKKMNRVRT